MLRRLCVIAALSCIFLDSVPAASAAATAAASLTVHIFDSNNTPIGLARATARGPMVLAAVSIRSGAAVFPALTPGTYTLDVDRYGFKPAHLTNVTLEPGQDLTLTIHLASTGLKQIADVAVRTAPKAAATISAEGTQAELDDSLVSALGSLPGFSYDANGAASIRGYSANQTTIEINGVPVSLPGSSQNTALFNAGVFSGASVTPGAGGGGTLGFTTRSPSLAWQGVVRAVTASNHGVDVAIQESGTVGQVGVSYTHARNVLSDPLDGRSFLDTSGLFYSHDASAAVDGDALQIRYQFSQDNTLLANAVTLDSSIPLVCRTFTGALPCGNGPTNLERENLATYQLRDFTHVGASSVDLTLYANHSTDVLDQSGYFVDRQNLPSRSASDSYQAGAIANLGIHLSDRFTLPLTIESDSSSTNATGNAFGPLLPSVLSRYSSLHASTQFQLITRPHFSLGSSILAQSYASESGNAARANATFNAGYRFSDHDLISARYSPGNLGTPIAQFDGVSAPAQLQFVCASNIGVGSGPTTASAPYTQTSGAVSYSHNALTWNAQVEAYRNVQPDAPISAMVAAPGLSPSYFAGDYLAQAGLAEREACGGSQPLTLSDLYFHVLGTASRAIYSGATISLSADLGSRVRASATYSAISAIAFGDDPLIFGPHSTVISGHQLPNVAPSSEGLTISAQIGQATTALVAAHGYASNNANNLPGYATFDAGILAQLPRGLLSITMSNVGNAYPGPFATASGAVPLPTSAGSFPTISQPLSPRTLRVGYRFHIGTSERQPTFSLPSDQYQPLGYSFTWQGGGTPFESAPPQDPFVIDRQSIYCGPKDVAPAELILAALKRYAATIENARTNGTYPVIFPPYRDDAITFTYEPNGASYVVTVAPTKPGRFPPQDFLRQYAPLESCALVHAGSDKELSDRHLLSYPSDAEFNILEYVPRYAPEVGLYRPGTITFKTSKWTTTTSATLPPPSNVHVPGTQPTAPSSEPFALLKWAGCSPEIQPVAQEFLDDVSTYAHAYFDLHEHPVSPQGMLIIPHTETSGKAWLELRAADMGALSMIEQCMAIKRYTHAYPQRQGLDGAPQPELNYTPSLGIYTVY